MRSRTHDRPIRMRGAAVALAALVLSSLVGLAGCNPLALVYFLQPWEPRTPGDGPKLEDKTVVVIAEAAPMVKNRFTDLEEDLTDAYVREFRDDIRKVRVISPTRFAEWAKDQPEIVRVDNRAIAEEFEADYVIRLEIQHFEVKNPSNPGLFYGVGKVNTKAYRWGHPKDSRGKPDKDQPKELDVVFEKFDDIAFPKHQGPIETDNLTGPAFYNRFVSILATELAWHFTGMTSGEDIQDTRGL